MDRRAFLRGVATLPLVPIAAKAADNGMRLRPGTYPIGWEQAAKLDAMERICNPPVCVYPGGITIVDTEYDEKLMKVLQPLVA